MLIDLETLIEKHKLAITGIIHVGAHYGEEYRSYIDNDIDDIVFVEPCAAAFATLQERFLGNKKVQLLNVAFGEISENRSMNIESNNEGQSNSLLIPKTHLQVHPEIKFIGQEMVHVVTMDSLNFTNKNLLMMDVQGFEKYVIAGGQATLKCIDYVYTEVNQAELYENCTQIHELDELLSDFTRVETVWCGNTGWGDAFYIRTGLLPKIPKTFVPIEFRQPMPFKYPDGNDRIFEIEYFLNSEDMPVLPDQSEKRIYLPIFWTSYYVINNYGKDFDAIVKLQQYLEPLPRHLKYYTIVQFDDGILNDLSTLDIKVYAMSGPRIDYALPLICKPHLMYSKQDFPRRYTANFVGNDNHPIRSSMIRALKMVPHFYVNGRRLDSGEFSNLLARSVFTLCPRGYGQTSFRICEALEMGSIPVYISDEHILPHNEVIPFTEYGLIVYPDEIKNLAVRLMQLMRQPDIIHALQENGRKAYRELYTYKANIDLIRKDLQHA